MRTLALLLQAPESRVQKNQPGWFIILVTDSQYVSIVYNERLTDAEITPSTEAVEDSYDNTLAENGNSSYNTSPRTRR